jgi:hypothetical protein
MANDHNQYSGQKVPRTGWSLFLQQSSSLLRKNALLSYRSRRATFLQLASSFFFIFLIFCVDQSDKARLSTTSSYKNLFAPQPKNVASIPACEDAYYIQLPCYDFIWSGSKSSRILSLVDNIMKNNPNRPIPDNKVKIKILNNCFHISSVESRHKMLSITYACSKKTYPSLFVCLGAGTAI